MKRILLSILVVFIAISVHSQHQDSTRIFKKDFGFNTNLILSSLINQGSAPFSLMYKIYTKPDKAIRIGLTASFSNSNTSGKILNAGYSTNNNGDIALTLGKEKQKHLFGKWDYYYGGDLLPNYTFSGNDYYAADSINQVRKAQTYKSTSWGIFFTTFSRYPS